MNNNNFADIINYITRYVYVFCSISLCVVFTSFPIVIALFFPINIYSFFLYIIAFSFVGPSFCAALSCMLYIAEKKREAVELIEPFRHFFSAYKKNFMSTIKLWIPFCSMAIALISLVVIGEIHLLVFVVIYSLIIANATIINTKFDFKIMDIVKLSFYFSIKKLRVTFGHIFVFVFAVMLFLTIGWLFIFLLNSVIFYMSIKVSMPMLVEIEENFIKEE